MLDKPLKITEYIKDEKGKLSTKVIILLRIKDTEKWQYVNLTRKHVCPCQFNSQKEALEDLFKYFDRFYKITVEDLEDQDILI